MRRRLPPALQPGDTIAFFSPSSPATYRHPVRFNRARRFLEGKGFRLQAGSLTGRSDGYRSGSIARRVGELNQLIRDPQVRCIISTIGGSNSNALLPHIDYLQLVRDPKIVVGYSDVTAILLGITATTGLPTFHGPSLLPSFGEHPPLVEMTFENFLAILSPSAGEHHYRFPANWSDEQLDWDTQDRPKLLRANDDIDFQGRGQIEGRLLGGNVSTMQAIWGSRYVPPIEDGDVLLLEDSVPGLAAVERSLVWLQLNEIFDRVSAVIFGKYEIFGADRSPTPLEILAEIRGEANLPPLVENLDCGHTHPMLTLPLGKRIRIDFDRRSISLIEPWVELTSKG